VLKEDAAMFGVGLGIGVALSLLAAPVMGRFLIGISPTDPTTYGEVAGLLLCVTLAACYVPVRRALRVNPLVALRQD
jgi:putative ABC transport system permease protein